MKKIINSIFILLLAGFVLQGCKDDVDYSSASLKPVSKLLLPDDDYDLKTIDNPYAQIMFSWESPDNKAAFSYAVAFYGPDGQEVYRTEADGNGLKTQLKLTHAELVKIAGMAGIAPEDTDDIYWNVISMLGMNESKPTAANRRITITRYTGFDDIPVSLYLYGEATEGGTDYENLVEMRDMGNGSFEIWTRLEGGKQYNFINRADAGLKRQFSINEDGILVEDDNMIMAEDGLYRIVADFKNNRGTVQQVNRMWYHLSWDNVNIDLDYIGRGHWESPQFTMNSNSGDTRYFFYVTLDNESREYKLGHLEQNTQVTYNFLTGDYFDVYLYEYPDGNSGEWNWWRCYKFSSELFGVDVKMHMNLSAEGDWFRHSVDVGDYMPAPVTKLNNPVDDATIDIALMGGLPYTFDWDPVTVQSTLPLIYELVFFRDEALKEQIMFQEEVSRDEIIFQANNNGRDPAIDVEPSTLQELSYLLTPDEDNNLSFYWTIRSRMLGIRVLGTAQPHKLTLKPVSLPNTLSFSGSSGDYGGSVQMKKGESEGTFEIWTQLNGTDYKFSGDNGRTYYADASGNLQEDTGSSANRSGIYKITVDMFTLKAKFEHIQRMRFTVPVSGSTHDMQYQGAGIWTLTNAMCNFWNGWGDDRVRLILTIDGTDHKYGSDTEDFGANKKVIDPEGTDPEYYVYPTPQAGDWSYMWKVFEWCRDKNDIRLNVKVNMSPTVDHYYIYFEYPDM